MAVNSITFGNINSADYGIYISGEGVFDAPKRAVEMVNVPGRSGAIALDQGYYENITVTYPAYNYEPDMADFKQALSDFRNALASQVGYQRLSDTFHPDEYRMAVFDEGLDINPIKYNTASQFDIKFDCKPQRYLTSGETEITVESGDTLTNPTQYESSPLLMVEGYGNISLNGFNVDIENEPMGRVHYTGTMTRKIPNTMYNVGDAITCDPSFSLTVKPYNGWAFRNIAATESDTNSLFSTHFSLNSKDSRHITTSVSAITFYAGTAHSETNTATVVIPVSLNGTYKTATVTLTQAVKQTVQADSITISVTQTYEITYTSSLRPISATDSAKTTGTVNLDSTVSLLGHPTYIDCDLGECYKIESGEYVSLNGKIALGSDLPTLASGENEVTFDNTITELKVVPRWWKL